MGKKELECRCDICSKEDNMHYDYHGEEQMPVGWQEVGVYFVCEKCSKIIRAFVNNEV